MRYETSFVINRPIDEVFAFTTNQENQPKWQSRVLEMKKTVRRSDRRRHDVEGRRQVSRTADRSQHGGHRVRAQSDIRRAIDVRAISDRGTSVLRTR